MIRVIASLLLVLALMVPAAAFAQTDPFVQDKPAAKEEKPAAKKPAADSPQPAEKATPAADEKPAAPTPGPARRRRHQPLSTGSPTGRSPGSRSSSWA